MPDFTNVVIYQPGGLSDTVFATPVASAVKQAQPGATVTWITEERLKNLLISVCPNIDEVIDVPAKPHGKELSTLIKRLKPDLFLNLGEKPVTAGFINAMKEMLSGSKILELVAGPEEGVHVVDSYLQAMSELGIQPPASPFPTIYPEAFRETMVKPLFDRYGLSFEEPLVGIVPGVGTGFGTKSWLSDGWSYLVTSIKENIKARCLLLGSGEDVGVCNEIENAVQGACINLGGQLSLVELSAVLKALALVIGGDCGAIHLAAAADTPVIGLYGPTKAKERGPYRQEALVIDQSKYCECPLRSVCQGMLPGSGNCMRGIMLSGVMEKVYMVLGTDAVAPLPVRDSTNWFWSPKRDSSLPKANT